jgi:hypothetical protein
MNPTDILAEYYDRRSKAFDILVAQGEQVARKAIKAAKHLSRLKPDLNFIEKAAKFFSKNGNGMKAEEKSHEKIINGLKRYGSDKIKRFQFWVEMFEY